MLAQIQVTLAKVKQDFSDSRVHHCDVAVSSVAESRYRLTGMVLDAAALTAVTAILAHQFPTFTFDTNAVQVLRRSSPAYLTVSANLAGYHRQPSRISERVSEVLNGQVLEKLLEQNGWVYVRQQDGYLGWVYRPYLTETPPSPATHIVHALVSLLRAKPHPEAPLVSRVMGGTMVSVTTVTGSWAHLVLAGERDGWVPLADLRDLTTLPGDENGRRQQMAQDSLRFIGVRYLWGGCTAQGIDCSGLAQWLHRQVGISIPRDADIQFAAQTAIEPPFKPGDLLFFGSGQSHRSITHVGISLGGWRTIHSSGPRNGVYEDDVQAIRWLRESFMGARSFINEPGMDQESQ